MTTLRAALSEVPRFFRWQCQNVQKVGNGGYARVGYELASSLLSVVPEGCQVGDWDRELTALGELVLPTLPGSSHIDVMADNGVAILGWFDKHFPACMELVPRQRREQFLVGVHQAVEEGVIELG